MVKKKRMMETDDSGVQRQFMPTTHVSAVLGLDEAIDKKISNQSRSYVNVSLKPEEYQKIRQIIADYDAGRLGNHP
ncbi:hypothetical protein IGJ91_001279 [Enterococcus sp. DIV0765f]|uniref:hypothetical protein n=1 Tax=Enterococcus sp. DIV0765f TaxID=2774783 RepID=UPI003F23982C